MPDRYEYIILGAGCAGLSLCYYLLEGGFEAPILILDRKSGFANDRTWCFWDVEETPFSGLARSRWSSWKVRAAGEESVHTTAEHPYLCVRGIDFYEHALERLAAAGNVEVRLEEEVLNLKDLDEKVLVRTSKGVYSAGKVFDARGLLPGSSAFEKAREEAAVWVPQKFLGLRLRTRRPDFEPEVCTLMDFSVSQKRGLRFLYVLPFGEREALVENVYLSEAKVSPEEHRSEIGEYLFGVYGLSEGDYEVLGEERGYIPMTSHRFERRFGERILSVGMLGGETRPSTGYTFLRIQRYCRRLAESLTGGGEPPEPGYLRRYALLDGLFLRVLRQMSEKCPEIYARMFAGVPPEALISFLTERSSLLDEARLIKALPKTPFVKTAARALLAKGA